MESRQPQPEQDATAASVLPDSVVALEALEKQEARSRPDSQVGHGKDIMPYESRASSVSGTPAMLFTENHPLKIAKYIARRATLLGWFDAPDADSDTTCFALKQPDGNYAYEPCIISSDLGAAIAILGENAIISMASEVTMAVVNTIEPGQVTLVVESTGARVPVVQSLSDVKRTLTQFSSSCIVLKEKCVLIWSHDPRTIINVAHNVEKQMLGYVVDPALPTDLLAQSQAEESELSSHKPTKPRVRGALDEKNAIFRRAIEVEEGIDESDLDFENNKEPTRPKLRIHAIRIGIVLTLSIVCQSVGVAKLVQQWCWDGDWTRFALAVVLIPLFFLSLFFFIVIVNSVFQILLPATSCLKNSKYHSATKPNPQRHRDYELPHITIQMPVYKEGLRGVIVPTIVSVMAAIQHYEELGGTASVFVNDDGMQCIQPDLAAARKQYYRDNGIGYCARLPNMKKPKKVASLSWFRRSAPIDPEVDNEDESELSPQGRANRLGFVRKGKFKKASNMNYCLDFSNRVEDEMHRLVQLECQQRGCDNAALTAEDDDRLYDLALKNMLASDEGKTWAEGNIRIGELILLIDCDTRVPVDCLLYGALEMHESPDVAILQHGSGVMQVAHNIFENGITYFTNIIYTAIKYAVGTGDLAPFVGHNAFLRWRAIQSVSFVDPSDGLTKYWSDSHVSEDFDIALRTQIAHMTCRLATYHYGGFQEGVSLTIYDELDRWEKYAYGCNELVFNPCYQWIYKGPFTRMFLRLLWSSIPLASKMSMTAYIFTYYAIAGGLPLTTLNYLLIGLIPDELDHFYLKSWGIWVSLIFVFSGISTLALGLTRHRLKEMTFWRSTWETLRWLPFMTLFFNGVSIHCAKALLCHAFSINIEWTSTSKELGPTGIYIGLNKMMHRFRYTFILCFVLAGGMVYFAIGAPWGWRISPSVHAGDAYIIAPLAIQVAGAFALPVFLGLT